jgi:pyruvate kinase
MAFSTTRNSSAPEAGPQAAALARLLDALQQLQRHIETGAHTRLLQFSTHNPSLGLNPSVRNLLNYLEFRSLDQRLLQRMLTEQGLSSLGRCEAHVSDALQRVTQMVQLALRQAAQPLEPDDAITLEQGQEMLARNTEALLGPAPPKRRVRIMVTLPAEAATDFGLVKNLVAGGMDVARINCAHDDPAAWQAMAAHVRQAANEMGHPCRIAADLAGHKIRTGPLMQVAGVLHLKPQRDRYGRVLAAARVALFAQQPLLPEYAHGLGLGIAPAALASLAVGDKLVFKDARGASRQLLIESQEATHAWATLTESAYLVNDLAWHAHTVQGEIEGRFCGIAPQDEVVHLTSGNQLRLTLEPLPGAPVELDPRGGLQRPAHIACTCPEVFNHLHVGQKVWIDDGKLGATVEAVDAEGALLRIQECRPGGVRLLADKGLNFPNMDIDLPALSHKDLADLDHLVGMVDIIGFSFVESGAHMQALLDQLAKRQAGHLGVIAKIETARAFRKLPEIMLAAMGRLPFGIMIARGDLAMEVGPERLAEVQEEILWLAEAAHLPVVWATQVLETLAKQGTVSRPELTDAAMGERAECVMLNKGPFIEKALASLDDILTRMQAHQQKKSAQLRALHWR